MKISLIKILEKLEKRLIKTKKAIKSLERNLAIIPDNFTAFLINSYLKITNQDCKQKSNQFGVFCYYSKFFLNKENLRKICKYNAYNSKKTIKKVSFPYYSYCKCNKDEK